MMGDEERRGPVAFRKKEPEILRPVKLQVEDKKIPVKVGDVGVVYQQIGTKMFDALELLARNAEKQGVKGMELQKLVS